MCSTGHYHHIGRNTLLGREIPKVAAKHVAKDVRQPRGNYRTCRLQHTRDFVSGNMRLTPPPPHVLLSTELVLVLQINISSPGNAS